MNDQNIKKIVIYQIKGTDVSLDVNLWRDSVWLTQSQIAELFNIDRTVITKHLRNIFKTSELKKISVCAIFAHTAADGKIYQTQYYNLDAVISVGYRVNSKQATLFRIWATSILRQHILRGYSLNEKRLLEVQSRFQELQNTISFIQTKATKNNLKGQEVELLNLLSDYSRTLSILRNYDQGRLIHPKGRRTEFKLDHNHCQAIVRALRMELVGKKEAGELFGNEINHQFESIIKNLYQTFGGKELYQTIEDKASHLIYLIIKDHPFSDGNKRIASYLFVYFLDRCNYLYRKSGEKKINDNALVALALLVAESQPREKEVLVKIISNLISS